MPSAPSRPATWALVLVGCTAVAVGTLAGMLAAGPWTRQLLAGAAAAGVAALGGLAATWILRRDGRRLEQLDEAATRFATLAGTTSVGEALAAAVDDLVAEGRLVGLHLAEETPERSGLAGVVVADAMATGLPAVLPDGTTGRERARLVALPIAHGGRRIGAAVLRLPGPPGDAVPAVQRLLVRVAPVLAVAAGGTSRAAPTPVAEGRGEPRERAAAPDDEQPSEGADDDEQADEAGAGSDDDLRAMIARGAHDLRTPLNTLAGMVDTLVRHGEQMPPSGREEMYAALQRSTRRIAGWVTVMLDAATDPAARSSRAVPTPLQPLLEEAATVSQAATAGLDVQVQPTDLHVVADPSGVVRAVSNLLANAGHHAKEGGGVEVEAQVRGDDVEVSVRDHGAGWRDEEPAGDDAGNARDGHHAGLGLGLASVRAQVAAWQGELELDETPGGGATVRFTLPRAVPAPSDSDLEWTIAGDASLLQGKRRQIS